MTLLTWHRCGPFHPALGERAPIGFGDGQVRRVTPPGSRSAMASTPDGEAPLLGGASQQGLRRVDLTPTGRGR